MARKVLLTSRPEVSAKRSSRHLRNARDVLVVTMAQPHASASIARPCFLAWRSPAYIQDSFPDLTTALRLLRQLGTRNNVTEPRAFVISRFANVASYDFPSEISRSIAGIPVAQTLVTED